MLTALDWTVVFLYLAGTVVLGLWYSGRQTDAEDYFTGGGRMAGLFQGVLVGLISFPICWVLMRLVCLKRYRRGVRTTAALMFVLLCVGWMSALIYAPTIALMGAADLNGGWFWVIALAIGLLATALAGVVSWLGDIFDITQTLLGAFFGPLLACVLFALLRAPLKPAALIAGIALGCAAGWIFAFFSAAQSLWVAPASLAATLLFSPLRSLLMPRAFDTSSRNSVATPTVDTASLPTDNQQQVTTISMLHTGITK